MDPEPSSRLHSRVDSRVASNADTRSETWSAASSTIVDTRSEPPRCYGKDADKIMRRATGKSAATSGSKEPMATPPVTLTAKIATNKNNSSNNNGSSGSGSGSGSKAGSKSSKALASASVSVASSAISGLTKQSTVNNNNNAKKSSSSSKSSSSVSININRGGSSSTSASAARSIDSSKKSSRSKKSSSSKAMTTAASASSKHQHHGRTTSPSVSAANTTSSSIRSSSNKLSTNNNNKSSSSSSLQQHQQSSNNHRHYGDAETTNSNSNSSHSHHSGSHISGSVSASAHAPSAELSNLALVPMTATAAGGAMDPPSGASTSGSSSSTECTGPTLYDPPTTDGNSTYASQSQYSQMSGSDQRSVSPNNDQLAVWSEGNDNDDEDTTTLRSDAISGASSESSYYSSDDDDDDDNEGGEHQRALVPIAEDRSSTLSSEEEEEEDRTEDSKNARALVQSDYHGGVNSHYDGDKHHAGAIVAHADPNNNRFLATAVDNHHAIVPIDSTIYEAYDHTFVTCPENLRFRFLYTFLKKNLDKKVMIFFSTTNSAKFHARLLSRFNIPVLTMHGNQRREKFIGRFFKFSDLEEGILCATDGAGRDLDIPPSVDWVIQFEPPDDPSEYILRVARISCDSDRVGRSLLFLNPGEQGFLKYYHSASIPVSEFEIPRQLADVQGTIERHVNDSERLLRCARDAYGSYLLAYASHGFRDVYNVHDLNKGNVALGFGLVGTLPGTADDMTTETDTLVSSYVNGIGGGELGGDAAKRKSSGSSSGGGGGGSKKSWEKKDKPKSKSWMRGEKSWPHSQIKLHPKFKGSDVEY